MAHCIDCNTYVKKKKGRVEQRCKKCYLELVNRPPALCVDCGHPCHGKRCQPCDSKFRLTPNGKRTFSESTIQLIVSKNKQRLQNPHELAKFRVALASRSETWRQNVIRATRANNLRPESIERMKNLSKTRDQKKWRESMQNNPCWKRGEENPHWKGGYHSETQRARFTKEYKQWRKSVFERDNYTCQSCKIRGGKLHPHHIKPFAKFVESRYDINNGITLCLKCHRAAHGYNFPERPNGID